MLLTLMMNVGMFGEQVEVIRQDLIFDSEFEGVVTVDGFEESFSVDSLIEQAIKADGGETDFGFDSGITTSI